MTVLVFGVQCLAATLALLVSLQGLAPQELTHMEHRLLAGLLLSSCGPALWLYLARKLNNFYPSLLLLLGGIFLAVFMIPGVYFPMLLNAGNPMDAALGIVIILALNLWSAYHARWAQMVLFKSSRST